MPAVPTKSYGRVPAGLHDLLYGEKDAEFTIQMSEFPLKTAKYAVYLGESLRINSEALIDIPANAAQIDQLLAEGGAYGREIFDKMNTAQGETCDFTDIPASGALPAVSGLQRAKEVFKMRERSIWCMNNTSYIANNALVIGAFDLHYSGSPDVPSRIGDTYGDSTDGTWKVTQGATEYWLPADLSNIFWPAFNQKLNTSSYDAMMHVTPFRGECLGAIQLVYLRAGAEATNQVFFDFMHIPGLIAGLIPSNPHFDAHLSNVYYSDRYSDNNRNGVWDTSDPLLEDVNGDGDYDERAVASGKDGMTMIPGDHPYFKNHDAYILYHSGGYWTGENCVFVGSGRFSGLGLLNETEDELRSNMRIEFNRGLLPNEQMSENDAKIRCRFTALSRIYTGR